jgi:hypothetical protein
MLRRYLIAAIAASAFIVAMPRPADAGKTNNFYGITVHVSVNNIKVQNPRTHETLSFLVTPHFDQIFSVDGKTTYQMKQVHAGQYVRIIYDQKMLGQRHADKIIMLPGAQ